METFGCTLGHVFAENLENAIMISGGSPCSLCLQQKMGCEDHLLSLLDDGTNPDHLDYMWFCSNSSSISHRLESELRTAALRTSKQQ